MARFEAAHGGVGVLVTAMDIWLFIHQHPAWVWAAVGAILLSAELVSGSGWLLWPAGSGGVVALLATVHSFNPTTQGLIFAVLSIASTVAGRRWVRARAPETPEDGHDVATRVVGRVAETASVFRAGAGRVSIDGEEWPAELEGGGASERGARVEVVALLEGARLRVRPLP